MIDLKNLFLKQPDQPLVNNESFTVEYSHKDHYFYSKSYFDDALLEELDQNTKFHFGISVKLAEGCSLTADKLWSWISYKDAAGNYNYANASSFGPQTQTISDKWTRFESEMTIPKGATIQLMSVSINSSYENLTLYTDNIVLYPVYDNKKMVVARDSHSFSKVLDGKKGDTGAKGPKGTDGISVTSVAIQYYLSTSSTSMAGGSWSADYPKWEPNKWVWIRQETTLSDGTKKYSDGKLWSNLNELYELETSNSAEIINTNDSIKSTVEQVNTYHSELSDAIKSNTDALDAFKANVSGTYATKSEIAQTSQSIQASIKKTISDSTYQTVSNVKLDESGLHVGTSNTQTESRIDGSGLTVSDADGNTLMNVTTAQSMIQNLKVTEKVQFGAHQIQAYSGEEADGSTVVGTAFLWIGDVK